MIITILREEYLKLVQAYLEGTKEECSPKPSISYQCCTAKLIQLFKWLTKDGTQETQLARREIHEKLLGEHGKDAIAAGIEILQNGLGILRVETNNRKVNKRNGQVKTFRYWLDEERLIELLKGGIVENSPLQIGQEEPEGEAEAASDDCSPLIDIEIPTSSSFNTPTRPGEGEKTFEEEIFEEETFEGEARHEEIEQIKAVIADAPFMRDDHREESLHKREQPVGTKFSATVARTVLERLRTLDVPLTSEVQSLVQNTRPAQMERNVSALEEEAATKGLRSPVAAFKHFVKNDCRPRNDPKSWWNRAMAALGKERFNQLIQAVTEYAGAMRIFFTNGQQLTLAQAQEMTWEAIAALGDEP